MRDRSTLTYMKENPYAQYFLGLESFCEEALFDASMMVHFRKRFPAHVIEEINEAIFIAQAKTTLDNEKEPQPQKKEEGNDDDGAPPNSGKMLLDATVAPADVRYPTDLSLLNECRENCEKIIDELQEKLPKPDRKKHKAPYRRRKARSEYLAVTKQKRAKASVIKTAIGRQLGYIFACMLLITLFRGKLDASKIRPKTLERISLIERIYEQQKMMYETGEKRCDDRIISLRQPHVRPIIRGKAGKRYEFGQKLTFCVVSGYTFIEKQSFNNFNEGVTLIESAEKYKECFGIYPLVILADQIYRNKANRDFCKKNGIRLSGPIIYAYIILIV